MTAPPPLPSAGRADRARSTIMPTSCGPWPASETEDQGAEWANGPHAGPIMRPTRKPM